MEHFFRSLKYLKPYRSRLALSILCVLVIMVLWGGGLGLMGPFGKVMLSDEGLHGWAYSAATQDRLEVGIHLQTVPPGTEIDEGKFITPILSVNKIANNSPLMQAGILNNDWIVGVYDQDPQNTLLTGLDIIRILANAKTGEELTLRVFNLANETDRKVTLKMKPLGYKSEFLMKAVSCVPEPKDARAKFNIFLWLLVIALLVTYLRNLFRFFQEYLISTAIIRGIMDLRQEAYEVALRIPMVFFSEKGTTDTMSRLLQDTGVLKEGQITLFGKTLAEPAKAVGSIIAAMFFSWKLTLITLIAGPPSFFLIRKIGKLMHKATKKSLAELSGILAILEETLNGIRVVKAYTMEGTERKRFFQANRKLYRYQSKIEKIDSFSSPAIESMGITGATLAAAVAGYMVLLQKEMTPDEFLALMICLAAMFDPIRKLSKVITRFQKSDAAAARVFEVIDTPQEKNIPGAPMLPLHSQSIEFRNVSFRYPNANEDALKNINLTLQAGQTVAFVGPNGCGKTTLLSLIPRLLDPTSGQVLIDGRDISQCSIRSLRRQIGLVTQDAVIFHASIAENISYGLRRAHHENILAAAKKAFVDEFVRDLPDGYDTIIGEHGSTLSGGQKQRISIARAILRDPTILIFDEATSQIDADSEQRIHQAMEEFVLGRTALMIAHRFQTVMQADRIVVMEAGRIVDIGKHHELMEKCALYQQLYNTQLGNT